MKNLLTQVVFILSLLLYSAIVSGQVTLPHLDPINYTVGRGIQSQIGWTTLNSGDSLSIASGNLSFSGLETSTGNKVTFDGSGIDAAKLFTQQTSGTVYYSFLLNVTALGSLNTSGSYFTGFTEGATTTFGGTVWLRQDGTGYDIGINPRTTAGNTVWSAGTQSVNNTLLIVISYQIVTSTTNDVVRLWINPTPGGSEPTATLTATNTGADLANLNRILLRQDGATTTPFVEMDELRIGTTWASVTPNLVILSGSSTLSAGPTSEPTSFSSLINTQGAAVHNFDFTFQDDGATPANDVTATQISQLLFRQGSDNDVADWTVALQGAELSDGTNTLTGTINPTNITFSSIPNSAGQLGHIADNASKTYTLKVWLKTDLTTLKTTIDGLNFVFRVINADLTITGSQLASGQDVNSGIGSNAVSVVATAIAFVQNTSNTDINNNMSPAPTVSTNDANGNRDLDYIANINITSTGTLTGTPVSVAPNSGLATFSSISHSATGTALILTAQSGLLTNGVSNTFNIILGPILTFEFAGITGSESSVNSSFNNSNLTISSITRGLGVTATANGDRFNSTGWTTNTSLDVNDYVEFTITPNSTYQFTITSVVINLQRSGTGPRAIALRSSVDSYAADLGAAGVIADNISTQEFTFTFSQTRNTATTYRIYMYNAEDAAGTGGPGDFTSGQDIIVNGEVKPTEYIFNSSWSPSAPSGISTSINQITVVNGNPILTANTTCSTLSLSAGTTLSIGSNTLTLNGAVSGSGTLSGSATSDLIIGGNVGTITFTSGSRELRNLVIGTGNNASLTLGSDLDVAPLGGITFNASGIKTLTTVGRVLTLKSTSAGSAYIGNINGATITGNITAERFISSQGRRWRFIGSPFSNATFEDLRQDMFITGEGLGNTTGTLNSNGFDATLSNQPSVFSYTESAPGDLNQGWTALTNNTPSLTNQTIVAGKGYRIFVRGDRSDTGRLTGNITSQNAVTATLTGTINTGNIAMPVTFTANSTVANDGWNLLCNPYPSAYNWDAFYDNGSNSTNIDPTIWILDATTNSYKSYNANSSGTLTDGIIPAGASFWVKANAASPSLTFTEQYKIATSPIALFKASADALQLSLNLDSNTRDNFMLLHNPTALKTFDGFDIRKLNGAVNIMAIGNDSISLALDARPLIVANDTINLFVSGGNNTYQLKVGSLPNANGKTYYLRDKKTGIIHTLSDTTSITYTSISTDSASFGHRFQLIISGNNALPVVFKSFNVSKLNESKALLEWVTSQETNNAYFEIERSIDKQKTWLPLARIKGAYGSYTERRYHYVDEYPSTDQLNYYRLKQVDYDHQTSYSIVQILAFYKPHSFPIKIHPNPVVHLLTIESSSVINVELVNISGKTEVQHKGNTIDLSGLTGGIYILKLTLEDGEVEVHKIVKQ